MENIIEFLKLVGKLKSVKRQGWLDNGLKNPESVSDHMYRMGIISTILECVTNKAIDINKCIKMSLIHDMAESIVGDITPRQGISKAEKFSLEHVKACKYTRVLCKKFSPNLTPLHRSLPR